jgi:hypothetical protein
VGFNQENQDQLKWALIQFPRWIKAGFKERIGIKNNEE